MGAQGRQGSSSSGLCQRVAAAGSTVWDRSAKREVLQVWEARACQHRQDSKCGG